MAHTVSFGLMAPGLAMWSGLLIADELWGSRAGLTSRAAVVPGPLDSLLGCQPKLCWSHAACLGRFSAPRSGCVAFHRPERQPCYVWVGAAAGQLVTPLSLPYYLKWPLLPCLELSKNSCPFPLKEIST